MKKKILIRLLFLFLILISGNTINLLLAEGPGPGSITVKKCQDFKITGNGSSAGWNSTEWISIVLQASGKSPYKTKAKVMYSDKGIYFLFNCEDKKITSTLKGDYLDLYNEDVVEVFLWPDENNTIYFEYEVSPLNYELPILIPNMNGTFLGWLPWRYEGERKTQHATCALGGKMKSGGTVSGWMAEFFIPYKLLTPLKNVPPVSGTKWRANMYRIDYDNGTALFAWQKINKGFHEYNNFGTFVFE